MRREVQSAELRKKFPRTARAVSMAAHVTPQARPPSSPVEGRALPARPQPPMGGGASYGRTAAAPGLVKRGQIGGGTGSATRTAVEMSGGIGQLGGRPVTEANDPYNTFYNPAEAEQTVRRNLPGTTGAVSGLARGALGAADIVTASPVEIATGLGQAFVNEDLTTDDVRSATRTVVPGSGYADDLTVKLGDALSVLDAIPVLRGPQIAARLLSHPRLAVRVVGALAAPVLQGGVGRRVAGELGAATGALVGADIATRALPEDASTPVRIAAAVGGSVVGGGAAIGGMQGLGAGLRAADRALIDVPIAPSGVRSAAAGRELGRMGAPTARVAGAAEPEQAPGLLRTSQTPETVTTVTDGIAAARTLRRSAPSQAASLNAETANALQGMFSKPFKGKDGNLYFRDITSWADGSPAPVADVFEHPSRYSLTDAQRASVDRALRPPALARSEHIAAGAGDSLHEAQMEEGQNFAPRWVLSTPKGDIPDRSGAGGGQRLTTGADKPRRYDDVLEGIRAGVVYADPIRAIERYNVKQLADAANARVANLFKPLSGTSALRVPAPLRARHDGLLQSLSSLKQTYARLNERLNTTISAYQNSAEPDLDALWDELQNIRVGANAVGKQGVNFGKDAPAVRAAIDAIRADIKEMAPEWRRAIRASKSVPLGRETVGDVAKALTGHDFDVEDARAIRRFYSNGVLPDSVLGDAVRGVRAVNQAIVPARAIGDASATLKQNGTILARHPVQFARNFGKSFYYSFWPGGEADYNAFLASERTRYAASRGVDLRPAADFYASWLNRIPGLKQTQSQFASIGTLNRVDLFYADLGLAAAARRSGKQPLFDAAEEAIARGANRITGVANRTATDAETLSEFAANWMRARLETLSHAVTDGGIDGRLAREYLATYVASGLLMSAAVAAAQGRDLREVLSPIRERDGRFHLNPNFGTVRVGGMDVSVFSSYIDLARLSVVMADATQGAIRERDAWQIFDAIGYAARTKGSPALTAAINAILGNNIVGQETRSAAGVVREIAPIPFTALNAVDNAQRGMGVVQNIADSATGFFGGSANPMSLSERRDAAWADYARSRDISESYWDAAPAQRAPFDAENPGFREESLEENRRRAAAGDEDAQTHVRAAEQKTLYLQQQQALDAELASGEISREQWREQRNTIRDKQRAATDALYADKPRGEPENALDRYGEAIRDATSESGRVDWDEVDAWLAAQPVPDQQYIDDKLGLGGTPTEKEYRKVVGELDSTGFFDLTSSIWPAIQEHEGYESTQAFDTYEDWYRAAVAEGARYYEQQGASPAVAAEMTAEAIRKSPVATVMSQNRNRFQQEWIAENPELAEDAYAWGYLSALDKTEERILQEAFGQ